MISPRALSDTASPSCFFGDDANYTYTNNNNDDDDDEARIEAQLADQIHRHANLDIDNTKISRTMFGVAAVTASTTSATTTTTTPKNRQRASRAAPAAEVAANLTTSRVVGGGVGGTHAFNLSHNRLTATTASLLATQVLRDDSHARLVSLDLANNNLNGDAASLLARALCHNSTLLRLRLCNNDLGTGCARVLGRMLAETRTLQYLSLVHTNLRDRGVAYIFDGVALNRSLRRLDVSRNRVANVDGEALPAICAALRRPARASLRELSLASCSLNAAASRAIAAAVVAGVVPVVGDDDDDAASSKSGRFFSFFDDTVRGQLKLKEASAASKRLSRNKSRNTQQTGQHDGSSSNSRGEKESLSRSRASRRSRRSVSRRAPDAAAAADAASAAATAAAADAAAVAVTLSPRQKKSSLFALSRRATNGNNNIVASSASGGVGDAPSNVDGNGVATAADAADAAAAKAFANLANKQLVKLDLSFNNTDTEALASIDRILIANRRRARAQTLNWAVLAPLIAFARANADNMFKDSMAQLLPSLLDLTFGRHAFDERLDAAADDDAVVDVARFRQTAYYHRLATDGVRNNNGGGGGGGGGGRGDNNSAAAAAGDGAARWDNSEDENNDGAINGGDDSIKVKTRAGDASGGSRAGGAGTNGSSGGDFLQNPVLRDTLAASQLAHDLSLLAKQTAADKDAAAAAAVAAVAAAVAAAEEAEAAEAQRAASCCVLS
jgi:hypothetical protein